MKRARALPTIVVTSIALAALAGPAGAGAPASGSIARTSPATPTLDGPDNGPDPDRLRLNSVAGDAGAEARLVRIARDGARTVVATGILNEKGNVRFVVADLNGRSLTKYVARIRATETNDAKVSNKKKVR